MMNRIFSRQDSKRRFAGKRFRAESRNEHESESRAVVTLESSPVVHLRRAAEIHESAIVEARQPKRFLGGLAGIVRRVRSVREKRPEHAETLARLEQIFEQLHQDFDERERMLDKKLQAIEAMQVRETRMLKWFSIPLAVIAMVGLSYLFYIAYSMQHSVADMSKNMAVMSGDISSMTQNTRDMTANMSQMTDSMYAMNNSMAYMTRDVSVMSRSVGSMSRSVAPIGKAAHTATPMIGMMRSFMPF